MCEALGSFLSTEKKKKGKRKQSLDPNHFCIIFYSSRFMVEFDGRGSEKENAAIGFPRSEFLG
jgi:hypothetical protein